MVIVQHANGPRSNILCELRQVCMLVAGGVRTLARKYKEELFRSASVNWLSRNAVDRRGNRGGNGSGEVTADPQNGGGRSGCRFTL